VRRTAPHAFKIIQADLDGGALKAARAVLLFGAEVYLTDLYERRFRALFVERGAEALDYARIDWRVNDVSETVSNVIAACDTLPMVSAARVVRLAVPPGGGKSLSFAEAGALAEYIPLIPEASRLIITAAEAPKTAALYKAIDKCGRAYEFDRIEGADARHFIRNRFRDAGFDAPAEVVNEILKVSGYLERDGESDLFGLSSDVAAVAAYARGGGEESVRLADVSACLGVSAETDVFAMLDAVSAGRKGEAMELVQNIAAGAGNAFGMLALLTSQFEIMLGYREMRMQQRSMDEVRKALGVRSAYRLKKAAGFADRYSVERLTELLHRLYRVDRDIKSGLYGERLALTMFIAEL
jgi:DNA polymerase-3 subunit delta